MACWTITIGTFFGYSLSKPKLQLSCKLDLKVKPQMFISDLMEACPVWCLTYCRICVVFVYSGVGVFGSRSTEICTRGPWSEMWRVCDQYGCCFERVAMSSSVSSTYRLVWHDRSVLADLEGRVPSSQMIMNSLNFACVWDIVVSSVLTRWLMAEDLP